MSTTMELVATLVAVGETASFSRAARQLGVSTGTVSRAIARLETQVGAQLVHRTTRRVSLSTAGQALFERAVSHVRGIEASVRDLPESQQEPAGTLRLSAPPDVGATILPEVLARYLARHPDVRVECDLSNRKVDLVAEGFDVALRAGIERERDPGLVVRRLQTAESGVYASPLYLARRGTPRDLWEEGHGWLGFAAPHKWHVPSRCRSVRVVGNDMTFLREAVRAGIGVGILPSVVAAPWVADGSLVRVLPRARLPSGALLLVYPAAPKIPLKVTAFRDVLLSTLR